MAQTFSFMDGEGNSLQDWTRLDTMVTVVDAVRFLGQQLPREQMLAELDAALLTPEELSHGMEAWPRDQTTSALPHAPHGRGATASKT